MSQDPGLRCPLGGLEGGFLSLMAVQMWQKSLGKELYSETTKKKDLSVCVHTHT